MDNEFAGWIFMIGIYLYFIVTFAIINRAAKAARKYGVSLPGMAAGPLSFLAIPACLVMAVTGFVTQSTMWALVAAVIATIASDIGSKYLFEKIWAKA